jgi:hypothetical protein
VWRYTPAMLWLSRSELCLAGGTLTLCLVALLAPAWPQDPAYHRFADTRALWGVPRALDVLSNLGFVTLGLFGLALMLARRLQFFSAASRVAAAVFFAGFVLTGIGSAAYHWAPDDIGLAWDRLGMVVAFAGVLGMVAAQRVSERAGAAILALALLVGPASVIWWLVNGSLTPYAVLQFGGMLLALLCLLFRARGPGPNWALLLALYALAKVAESLDSPIFASTGELVSGHTLKHLLAWLAALAVILPLFKASACSRRSSA